MSPEERMKFYAWAKAFIDENREATTQEIADAIIDWVDGDTTREMAFDFAMAAPGRVTFDRRLALAEEFATYAQSEPKPLTGKGSGKKRGKYRPRQSRGPAVTASKALASTALS